MEKLFKSNGVLLLIQSLLFSSLFFFTSLRCGIIAIIMFAIAYAIFSYVIVRKTSIMTFDIEDIFTGVSWFLWSFLALCLTYDFSQSPHFILLALVAVILIALFYVFSIGVFEEDPGLNYLDGVLMLTPIVSTLYGLTNILIIKKKFA